jgi:aspartyl-tRNA(Asn)/glutamyl-tRNA(Gln) amidotransferase subunit C
MISKEEVQHIAKLARLELTEKEIEKMQKDLSEILDYFDLLKKAPTKILQSKNLGGQAENLSSLRKDEVVSNHDIAGEMIKQVPDQKDGYIKVKNIF